MNSAPVQFVESGRYENAAQWVEALGDVPLRRILFTPWPGTATEAHLLHDVERDTLCELVDGTLVEKEAGYWESVIAMNLAAALHHFVTPRGLGLVSGPDSMLRMRDGHVRLPDVAFVSTQRLPSREESIPTVGPDLAVEVLSEGNTAKEMLLKRREYFASGTRLVWEVDPRTRSVGAYEQSEQAARWLCEGERLDGGEAVPGFSVAVEELFRNSAGEQ